VIAVATKAKVSKPDLGKEAAMAKSFESAETRGKSLAAMGLVTRDEGGTFFVKTAATKDKQQTFEVGRYENKKVYCQCPSFQEYETELEEYGNSPTYGEQYRCEHIYAAIQFALTHTAPAAPTLSEVAAQAATAEVISVGGQAHLPVHEAATEQQGAGSLKEKLMRRDEEKQMEQKQALSVDTEQKTVGWFGALMAKIPADKIKQREGWRDRNGNTHYVDYVEWHFVVERLNSVLKENWSYDVELLPSNNVPIFKATIILHVDGQDIKRSGIGTGKDWEELGIKKGASDALKRAAVNFGIAIELYYKDLAENYEGSGDGNGGGGQPNPIARSLSDLITAKQLGMVRALAREIRVDPDEECTRVNQCKTDELSRKAGSNFIQHLQDLQKKQGGGNDYR
jgi:hypothetical protein